MRWNSCPVTSVPVGFTWWRLSDALEAHERAASDESFLLGWQRGFGGQVPTLSTPME